MDKRQIIINTDGGSDDFIAILYAVLSQQFDIKGITLEAGNTDVNNVRRNVFKALNMAGIEPEEAKKIGVYLPEYINENIIPDGAYGENGLGNVEFDLPIGYESNPEKAEEILIKKVNEQPGKISIISIGPLTNIANAIKRNSDFIKNTDELVILGGDEGGGNITPYAEFNVYQDPEAAKRVFEAGFKKITMIGFNISKTVTICPEIETFLKQNNEMGRFIYDSTRVTADLDIRKSKVDGARMNDILTLLYLLDDGKMFKTKKGQVIVDISMEETRGKTSIRENTKGESFCNIVTEVESTLAIKEMLTILFPGQEEAIEKLLKQRKERMDNKA